MVYKLICSSFFLIGYCFTNAQNYTINELFISTCTGNIYDSGSNTNNYNSNENFITTICSDSLSSDGTHIQLIFQPYELGEGDDLCVYDGTDTTETLITCLSNFPPQSSFIVQASSINTSGCLTLLFQSDTTSEGAGWSASIGCIPSCQRIEALINTIPPIEPIDTGWIDICQGDTVFFSAEGYYPENGASYLQSDDTALFEWDFGDMNRTTGNVVSHVYKNSGGFYVTLVITDHLGCKSVNSICQRVRVSPSPSINLGVLLPDEICVDDTLNLRASINQIDTTAHISFVETQNAFNRKNTIYGQIPLPDGDGTVYEATVFISDFSPQQNISTGHDIESICVTMEHSWARDLEIWLTCPSGDSVLLHKHLGEEGEEIELGLAHYTDSDSLFGIGYEYCWTLDATNGTWVDWFDEYEEGNLPAEDYQPYESFNNFIDCSLNGAWTLGIADLWAEDNGFLFSWSINFKEDLYPRLETFTPSFDYWGWEEHPSIIEQTVTTIIAAPQNAGAVAYNFYVTDEFGCTYDTTLISLVYPETHENCRTCEDLLIPFPDTVICEGDNILLIGGLDTSLTQAVTFVEYSNYNYNATSGVNQPLHSSIIEVNSIIPVTLENPLEEIVSICAWAKFPNNSFPPDISLYVIAPDNTVLSLSDYYKGSNYLQVCFTPDADTPINSANLPFAGNYQSQEDWNILTGVPINGEWRMFFADSLEIKKFKIFSSWSITFKSKNEIEYTWSSEGDLPCINCPQPLVTPMESTNYIIQAEDDYNCMANDNIYIEVIPNTEKDIGIFVPTAFSPNDDGTNDKFIFYSNENRFIKKFQIFDRWGELIHEEIDFWIDDNNFGWDGRFKGKKMPSGVYVWYIDAHYNSKFSKILSGHTTLIK